MNKKVAWMGLALLLLGFALPAAAQETTGGGGGTALITITSGLAMAIASSFCGLAQAKASAAASEAYARNPGAAGAIRFGLILSLVLIESLALYTFAIIYLKV
jgi:F-type H+-transporting ATPase subunit c